MLLKLHENNLKKNRQVHCLKIEISEMNLIPLQDALKNLYIEFARFCNSNGITFYLAYGTLLGAIRHKGFIPWDDDWDIYMPRPDYERFIAIRHLLPSDLKFSSIETNSKHTLLFGKVYKDLTDEQKLILESNTGLALSQGLFIDIFPLDGMPSNIISLFIWRIQRALRRRFQSKTALQLWFKSFSFEKCKYVGVCNCEQSSPKRYRYLKSFFDKPRIVQFDDIKVQVPSRYEEVLNIEFGNWRELPPESSRQPGHTSLMA